MMIREIQGLGSFRPSIELLKDEQHIINDIHGQHIHTNTSGGGHQQSIQDQLDHSTSSSASSHDGHDGTHCGPGYPELCPGDLIEIDRTLYVHWALYVGNGTCIHIVGEDNEDMPTTEHAYVRETKLVDLAGQSYVRVNNKEVPAKERGLVPFEPEEVVAHARSMVGSLVWYNLLTKNNEHYLTLWKYGFAWSDQAAYAMAAIKALQDDSNTVGHNFLAQSLNEVINSPGANTTSYMSRSPSSDIPSSPSSDTHTEPVAHL